MTLLPILFGAGLCSTIWCPLQVYCQLRWNLDLSATAKVASTFHAVIAAIVSTYIIVLGEPCLGVPYWLQQDTSSTEYPAYFRDPSTSPTCWSHQVQITLSHYSLGYFLWDCMASWSLRYKEGDAFLWHAIACALSSLAVIHGAVPYFAPRVMVFEWSTPFFNAMSYFDRVPEKKLFQSLAIFGFVSLFLIIRVYHGTWLAWVTCVELKHLGWSCPSFMLQAVNFGILQTLNWYWCTLIVQVMYQKIKTF